MTIREKLAIFGGANIALSMSRKMKGGERFLLEETSESHKGSSEISVEAPEPMPARRRNRRNPFIEKLTFLVIAVFGIALILLFICLIVMILTQSPYVGTCFVALVGSAGVGIPSSLVAIYKAALKEVSRQSARST